MNNSIKHYVLIRFYCMNMMDKNKLFDDEILSNGVDIFKHFCLPSLENQTNKNFETILMIHDDIDWNNPSIEKLCSLAVNSSISLIVAKYSAVHQILLRSFTHCNYFITSRIDHDDMIYNNAVEDAQSLINPKIPYIYNGYLNGITMKNDEYNDAHIFNADYHGEGSISIFQSLIINRTLSKNCINIYELGSHTQGKTAFKKLYEGLEYKDSYFNLNTIENAYVYCQHDFNHSSFVHNALIENWHRSDVLVNKNYEYFKTRFGLKPYE